MARTYHLFGCLISIKTAAPNQDPPVWNEGLIWVAVRLEDTFYRMPGVSELTRMRTVEQIKRDDPQANILIEYQITDALKKGFVHKLNMTIIPADPALVYPPFGNSYKTTLVVSGDLNLRDYIPNVLAPFTFTVGQDRLPYIIKPGSISPVGGRRNKERF